MKTDITLTFPRRDMERWKKIIKDHEDSNEIPGCVCATILDVDPEELVKYKNQIFVGIIHSSQGEKAGERASARLFCSSGKGPVYEHVSTDGGHLALASRMNISTDPLIVTDGTLQFFLVYRQVVNALFTLAAEDIESQIKELEGREKEGDSSGENE